MSTSEKTREPHHNNKKKILNFTHNQYTTAS